MDNESIIRVLCFFLLLVMMLTWEQFFPRRSTGILHRLRQVNNLLLLVIDVLAVRLLFPIAVVGMAELVNDRGWGLFNLLQVHPVASFLVSLVVLDLVIYLQHVAFHKIPIFWKFHRVHHTDKEIDVTTGIRFHPFEILLSMLLKMFVVFLLGAPVLAVLVFEILLFMLSMFNHGNVFLPLFVDRYLRYFIVTPDMHRVHHSVIRKETDSNYGFFLTVWDRVFGTYRDQPQDGHINMQIGLSEFSTDKSTELKDLLLQPFFKLQR